jgi:hypothetical protein
MTGTNTCVPLCLAVSPQFGHVLPKLVPGIALGHQISEYFTASGDLLNHHSCIQAWACGSDEQCVDTATCSIHIGCSSSDCGLTYTPADPAPSHISDMGWHPPGDLLQLCAAGASQWAGAQGADGANLHACAG